MEWFDRLVPETVAEWNLFALWMLGIVVVVLLIRAWMQQE